LIYSLTWLSAITLRSVPHRACHSSAKENPEYQRENSDKIPKAFEGEFQNFNHASLRL